MNSVSSESLMAENASPFLLGLWLWNSRATVSLPWIRWGLRVSACGYCCSHISHSVAPVLNISLSRWIKLPLILICFMSTAIYSDGSAWSVSFKLLICPIHPLVFLQLSVYVSSLALRNLAGQLPFPCPFAVYGCSTFSLIGQ